MSVDNLSSREIKNNVHFSSMDCMFGVDYKNDIRHLFSFHTWISSPPWRSNKSATCNGSFSTYTLVLSCFSITCPRVKRELLISWKETYRFRTRFATVFTNNCNIINNNQIELTFIMIGRNECILNVIFSFTNTFLLCHSVSANLFTYNRNIINNNQ